MVSIRKRSILFKIEAHTRFLPQAYSDIPRIKIVYATMRLGKMLRFWIETT